MIWEEIVNRSAMMDTKTHLVFQEEMQKTILTAFSREEVFNDVVFQGGTSLRLFYGNPRFSEDLDFVLRQGKNTFDLTKTIAKVKTFIQEQFPFIEEINVGVQKNDQYMQRFILQTSSDMADQKIRINIELASVPSYRNHPKILDYPPLNPAVRVEDAGEILADKVTALGSRPYVKGRDIWDIYFLFAEKHLAIPWDLVFQKTRDYGGTPAVFITNLSKARERLKTEGVSILSNEIKRFLPKSTFDRYCDVFDDIITQVAEAVEEVESSEG